MRLFARNTAVGLAVLVVVATAVAPRAQAATLNVSISQEGEAVANQPAVFTATVTGADNGRPAFGVSVAFYTKASFGKTTGNAEIGHGVTDAQGVVSISYVLRESGEREISAEATAKDGSAGKASTTITVGESSTQEYVQTAGIRVPGLNAWLIIALLSVVWGILFWVAVTVVRIAGAGDDGEGPTGAPSTPAGARAARGGR